MSTLFVTFSDTLHLTASYFATGGFIRTDFVDLADANGKLRTLTWW
jgi:hypothetical protein